MKSNADIRKKCTEAIYVLDTTFGIYDISRAEMAILTDAIRTIPSLLAQVDQLTTLWTMERARAARWRKIATESQAERDELEKLTKHLGACEDCYAESEYRLSDMKEQISSLVAERDILKAASEDQCKTAFEYEQKCADIANDRDRWKARAEALEKALMRFTYKCQTCKYTEDDECTGPPTYCKCGSAYVFDEARFAGGKG